MSRNNFRFFSRPVSVFTSALALATLWAPGRVAAQCIPTITGTPNVSVDLVRDAGGVPVALDDSTDRREHARVSNALAQDLGMIDPNTGVFTPRQIRVIVDAGIPGNGILASGLRATANFTAIEVFTDPDRELEIYAEMRDVAPVAFGSTWMVSDAFDEDWLDLGFPEAGWVAKQAIVGYGRSNVNGTFTPSSFTAYLRLTFDVDDPALYDSLDLALFRDDGAVVYLNGNEVLRSNLPAGTLDADTLALSHSEALVTTTVATSLLQAGANVLAVEVHNRRLGASTDLQFDLELSSRICRPCLGEVTVAADRGTYLRAGSTSPKGSSAEIQIDNSTERSGLIGFPLAGAVPAGADVLHAELALWIEDDSSHIYRFYPVLRAWNEAEAIFAEATSATDGEWEIDGAKGVTDRDSDRPVAVIDDVDENIVAVVVLNVEGRDIVEEWVADPATNHGLIIPGDEGSTNDLYFASDDDPTDPGPTLRVVYATSCGG